MKDKNNYTKREVEQMFRAYICLNQAQNTFEDNNFDGDKLSLLEKYKEIYEGIPKEIRYKINKLESFARIAINTGLPLRK